MLKIQADIAPFYLLHIIVRKEDLINGRLDVTPENEYLQLSGLNLNSGKKFKAHKHIPIEKLTDITQESWVVIQGKVRVILYDLDDNIIHEDILNAGDVSITFRGGHNYEILEDNSLIYEYKTGPYLGQLKDKVFIE